MFVCDLDHSKATCLTLELAPFSPHYFWPKRRAAPLRAFPRSRLGVCISTTRPNAAFPDPNTHRSGPHTHSTHATFFCNIFILSRPSFLTSPELHLSSLDIVGREQSLSTGTLVGAAPPVVADLVVDVDNRVALAECELVVLGRIKVVHCRAHQSA